MLIEQKRIRVRPDLLDRFLALDAEVWTASLAREPGFLGKESWVTADNPDEVVLVVRWQSRGHWQGVSRERQDDLTRAFARELPAGWEELETRVYEVVDARALAALLAGGLATAVP